MFNCSPVGLCDLVSGATFLFIKNSNVETETRSRSTVYEVAVYGGGGMPSHLDMMTQVLALIATAVGDR